MCRGSDSISLYLSMQFLFALLFYLPRFCDNWCYSARGKENGTHELRFVTRLVCLDHFQFKHSILSNVLTRNVLECAMI